MTHAERLASIEKSLMVLETAGWQEDIEYLFIAIRTLQARNEKLREALKIYEGYLFMATQPDQGNLFGECDDKIREALSGTEEL